jgi:hypothetical protein
MLRRMSVARWILLMGCVAVLGGCGGYAAPSLHMSSARVTEQTAEGYVIDLAVDATNTNSVELPLKEIRYSVSVDGRQVFSGVRSPEATLRRLGTQTFHIPAVGAGAAPTAGSRYVVEGRLRYLTPGRLAEVLFDIKVRRPTVRFREEGTLGEQEIKKAEGRGEEPEKVHSAKGKGQRGDSALSAAR